MTSFTLSSVADNTDERKNRPSASAMHRLFACPGSWLAEQKCPKLPPSPAAMFGTRLHSHMQHGTDPADPAELEAVQWCREQERNIIDEILGTDPEKTIREKRLWHPDNLFSGQADVIYIHGDTAIVFDYKFGRGEVQPAPENVQLLALSVLVFYYFDVQTVVAGILQPYADNRNAYELADYNREDFLDMASRIKAAIIAARAEDAALIPSAMSCKYCRAAATCPAAWQASLTQRDVTPLDNLSGEVIANLIARANMAERVAGAVKESVKQYLKDGGKIPGYTLTNGKTTYTITDAQEAFSRLNSAHGITAEQFANCCKVNMTSLYSLFYNLKKQTETITQKNAKAEIQTLLAPCMTATTSDGSIKRIYND